MPTTINNPERVGSNAWKYSWSGTAPYRIFNYETYTYISNDYAFEEIIVLGESDTQPPPLDIFGADESTTPDGDLYPAQVYIQFRGVAYAKEYKVVDDDTSTTLATIPETGRGYYDFLGNKSLDDGTVVNYTVNVVDKDGNESAANVLSLTTISNPGAVGIDWSYASGTGILTVTPE